MDGDGKNTKRKQLHNGVSKPEVPPSMHVQSSPGNTQAGHKSVRLDSGHQPASSGDVMQLVAGLNDLLDADPLSSSQQELIAQSAEMHDVIRMARLYASRKPTVLIQGETGTGKELIAQLIHTSSPRSAQPFVRVNCAALSETLIESELFGHKKGAFTGAFEAHVGKFEYANGGTILLDEISETPIHIQAKLLRVLEQEEIQKVGCNQTKRVDVRVVATSNRDLESECSKGTFRLDLFYRLNVASLVLPPLRERQDDIPVLANHFVHQFKAESGNIVERLSDRAIGPLQSYEWPGNIRQLKNAVHRACVLAESPELQPEDLLPQSTHKDPSLETLRGKTLEEIERIVILDSLRRNKSRKNTALELGVTTRTLLNKMNKYEELGCT